MLVIVEQGNSMMSCPQFAAHQLDSQLPFGCPLGFPLWVISGIKYLKISKKKLDIAQNYPLVNLWKQPFLRLFEKSFRNGP